MSKKLNGDEISIMDTAEVINLNIEKAVDDKPKISFCPECKCLQFPIELYESVQAGKCKITHREVCLDCLNLVEAPND